jgi:rhodanese-related sulfurtransferase
MDKQSFFENSFESWGLRFISPRNAFPLCLQGAVMVDLRPDWEGAFKRPDVPELMLLPYTEIDQHINLVPRDRFLILGDCVGLRSKEVLIKLINLGFTNIVSMAGGFVDWERDGLPIVVDMQERLTGSCMCQLKPREKNKG